jgi:hypothetical protein
MVGGFELAGRLVMGVRAVVEAAVGKRAAEPFVKEQEEQGDLNPFWGETVGVAGSVTLQQPVGFEFAQVVAELVQPVGAVGEVEGGEDAWWMCLAVQPPTSLPPCKRTSRRR